MSDAPRYELRTLLGEGGMGRVYSAVHWPTETRVAVKTLRPEASHDPVRRRLLLDEATAAARIRDPNVVALIDVGTAPDGSPFLVLDLCDGHDLELYLREWPGWPRMLDALAQTLAGLGSAHAAGIVHRDLKPGNVLVERATGRVRLLDFGIAELVDPLRQRSGRMVAGTPEFMAPEQLLGSEGIGPWSDLYAFGIVLCHAIFGTSPFHDLDADLGALLELKRNPGPFAEVVPPREGLVVPPALLALAARLLHPHPRLRPRFACAVREELLLLGAQVLDHVPLGEVPRDSRPELSVGPPTTVDPAHSPTGLISVPESVSQPLDVGTDLPAILDPRLSVAPARLGDPPLVGRVTEREALLGHIEGAIRTGVPRLVVYVGAAGVGKSAIARWGLSEVERRGLMDGIAGGYDRVGADLAAGLRHALLRLFPTADDDGERALGWLEGKDPALDISLLARFLRGAVLTETLARARIVELAASAIVAAAGERPVFLWLDDLLLSSDGGLEVVERLLSGARGRVLIVATVRTPEDELAATRLRALAALPQVTVQQIDPLGQGDLKALLFSQVPLREPALSRLSARLPGSPLYVRGAVVRWLEAGLLAPAPGGWDLASGVDDDDISATRSLGSMVEDHLAAFFGELRDAAAAAEGVLFRAALLGQRFDEVALRATVESRRELKGEVDRVLERAIFRGLIRADGAHVFSFDHGLVHDALLARAERSPDRQRLLIDTANGLQARYGKDRADVAGNVALLLRRAKNRERAWERLLHAIELSAWAADETLATSQLSVAREWLREDGAGPLDMDRAHVDWCEARIAYFALRYPDAEVALGRALGIAHARGDQAMLHRGEAFRADLAFYQDRFAEAEERASRCLTSARASEDPDILAAAAAAAARLADLAALRDQHADELRHRNDALTLLRAAAAPGWRERIALLNLAEAELVAGDLRAGEAHIAEARRSATTAHDTELLDTAKETLAHFLLAVGDPAEARTLLSGRIERIERGADRWRRTVVRLLQARLALALDGIDAAVAATAAFLDSFAEVPHDEPWTRHAMRELASGLSGRGHAELAARVSAALASRDEAIARGFMPATG